MGIDNSVASCGSDVRHDGLKVGEIGCVKGSSYCALCKTLHEEGDSEDVHSLIHKGLNRGGQRPCVVSS